MVKYLFIICLINLCFASFLKIESLDDERFKESAYTILNSMQILVKQVVEFFLQKQVLLITAFTKHFSRSYMKTERILFYIRRIIELCLATFTTICDCHGLVSFLFFYLTPANSDSCSFNLNFSYIEKLYSKSSFELFILFTINELSILMVNAQNKKKMNIIKKRKKKVYKIKVLKGF